MAHGRTKLTILVLMLGACEGSEVPHAREVRADLERDLAPAVDAEARSALVAGNSAFAVDLYRSLAREPGNVFCSPHSISLALAMAYGGARGETERQMADGMHFTLAQDDLHPAFDWLDLELQERAQSGGLALEIDNSIWGAEGLPFRGEYLDLLALDYGAGLRVLDFASDPSGARAAINGWVEEQTHGRIADLLPSDSIDEQTLLVLTNTIYFQADWEQPFEHDDTRDETFTLGEGDPVSVPTMRQEDWFAYAEGDGYQAVELPYEGGAASMVLVLPPEGGLDALEDGLDAAALDTIVSSLERGKVDLQLPRFSFASTFGLLPALAELGMTDLDDFSGIADADIVISKVIHEAFVSVDEKGTEAAAATAIEGAGSANEGPIEIHEMHLDHPFLFLIRDVETGAILFLGRVVDPRPGE